MHSTRGTRIKGSPNNFCIFSIPKIFGRGLHACSTGISTGLAWLSVLVRLDTRNVFEFMHSVRTMYCIDRFMWRCYNKKVWARKNVLKICKSLQFMQHNNLAIIVWNDNYCLFYLFIKQIFYKLFNCIDQRSLNYFNFQICSLLIITFNNN